MFCLRRALRLPTKVLRLRSFVLWASACLIIVVLYPLIVNDVTGDRKRTKLFTVDNHNLDTRHQQLRRQHQQRKQNNISAVQYATENEDCSQSSCGTEGRSPRFRVQMRSDSLETEHKGAHFMSRQCAERYYGNLTGWPTASVIITYCDNERVVDLIHTLHSIIQRTPDVLLQEILLVDDNTKRDDFKETFDNYCRAVFGRKLRKIRSDVTLGLIKARLLGARHASGDVIVMLDAHMEVQEKWLEAILIELKNDRKIVATISMDWMMPKDDGSWIYEHGPGYYICSYGWDLVFGYAGPRYPDMVIYKKNQTRPMPTPCSIGNWAMDRMFFKEIGELDENMLMWGGENLDIAIRTWLFGGRVLHMPCSHVAHQERPGQRDYRSNWTNYTLTNYRRVVEVWFDEYKRYFYEALPAAKSVPVGNLTSRMQVKAKALHNFEWYLANVFPGLGVYDKQSLAYRNLRNLALNKCATFQHGVWHLKPNICKDRSYVMFLSSAFILRMGPYIYGMSYKEVFMTLALSDIENNHTTKWIHWKNGPLKPDGHDLCLQHNEVNLTLETCNPCLLTQRWTFDQYTPEYQNIMTSPHNGRNKTAKRDGIIEHLLRLKAEWPEVVIDAKRNDASRYKLC